MIETHCQMYRMCVVAEAITFNLLVRRMCSLHIIEGLKYLGSHNGVVYAPSVDSECRGTKRQHIDVCGIASSSLCCGCSRGSIPYWNSGFFTLWQTIDL